MILDLFSIGRDLLLKLIPDRNKRLEFEEQLEKLKESGELKREELRYSAINTELSSEDKITSRSRPTFLYVMYIIILSAIPMGILYAFNPVLSKEITIGFKAWLDAIPSDLWMLFGAGYLGYGAFRSYDKKTNYNKY